jgi:hypothetical protein
MCIRDRPVVVETTNPVNSPVKILNFILISTFW